MPTQNWLNASAYEDPRQLLTFWKNERAYRVGKSICYGGVGLSIVAIITDSIWSELSVILTDVVLLVGCLISLFWIHSETRPRYFWWPAYLGFWICILPSLWNTGGLLSPFLGVDIAVLYLFGAVMDTENKSHFYFLFALLHLPALYLLEFFYPLSSVAPPPLGFTMIIMGITFMVTFLFVHALLRTENALSDEISASLRRLHQTQDTLKEAQSIGHIGSWEWDLDDDRIAWSDELFRIFAISKENFDPSYKAYIVRQKPEFRERIDRIIQSSIKTGDDFSFENRFVTPQGERVVLSRGRAVRDDQGRTIKMRGTSQDITDRVEIENELRIAKDELEKRVEERTLQLEEALKREKAAKEAAERANQAKMQFLANMSHEIRTPMNSILGFSELLYRDENLPEKAREYLKRIRSNGSQLLHLIDDILDLSKFEAGQIPVHKNLVSIRELLGGLIDSFQPSLKEHDVELMVRLQDDLPDQVFTDGPRLGQVITNLLSNAIKFSEKGEVHLSVTYTTRKHDMIDLIVNVKDTGIGIEKENQKNLFRPFSQGDASISRKFGGSGLGLALSKHICDALNGDLFLVSSEPGKGAHFRFTIPVLVVPVQSLKNFSEESKPIPSDKSELSFDKMCILLAEDSPDNALLIREYLKPLGVKIEFATNGHEVLEKTESHAFDCILMDIQMPGMDGLEATRKLRARGFSPPIIALTAHALQEEVNRSIEAGCNVHLTKPVDRDELINTLKELLSKSSDKTLPDLQI